MKTKIIAAKHSYIGWHRAMAVKTNSKLLYIQKRGESCKKGGREGVQKISLLPYQIFDICLGLFRIYSLSLCVSVPFPFFPLPLMRIYTLSSLVAKKERERQKERKKKNDIWRNEANEKAKESERQSSSKLRE